MYFCQIKKLLEKGKGCLRPKLIYCPVKYEMIGKYFGQMLAVTELFHGTVHMPCTIYTIPSKMGFPFDS